MDISQPLKAERAASSDSDACSSMLFAPDSQWLLAAAQPPEATPAPAASAGRQQQQQQQEEVLSGPVLHTGFFEAQLQQELANSSMLGFQGGLLAADSNMAALDEQIMLLERELLHSAAADRHAAACSAMQRPAHVSWQAANQQQLEQQRQFSMRQQELDEQMEQHRQASLLVEQQLRMVQQRVSFNTTASPGAAAAAAWPSGAPAAHQAAASRMQCAMPHVTNTVSNTVSNKHGRNGERLEALHARLGGLTAEYCTLESSLQQLQLLLGRGAAPAAATAGVSGSMSSSGVSGGSCIGGTAGGDSWGCQQQQQQQDVWQEPPAQPQLPLPIASCGVYSNGVCFFV